MTGNGIPRIVVTPGQVLSPSSVPLEAWKIGTFFDPEVKFRAGIPTWIPPTRPLGWGERLGMFIRDDTLSTMQYVLLSGTILGMLLYGWLG